MLLQFLKIFEILLVVEFQFVQQLVYNVAPFLLLPEIFDGIFLAAFNPELS